MTTPSVPLIPRDLLFGNPEKASAQLSPDGSKIGYIAPVDGVLNVWVGPVGGEARPITHDTNRGVRMWGFAHDNAHALYLQDIGGDENWHLHLIDLETAEVTDVTPFEGVRVQIAGMSKRLPDVVMVAINADNPQLHDLHRLTLSTGKIELVEKNPGSTGAMPFVAWLLDDDLVPRGGVCPTPDGGMVFLVRPNEGGDATPILVAGQDDALTTSPVAITADGASLLAISSIGGNTGRLVSIDLASGAQTVIAEDPRYDVTGAIVNPDTTAVEAVGFLRDKLVYEHISDAIAADMAALGALHPGYQISINSRTDADDAWLVAFMADDGPVRYYHWDRSTQTATFLFTHQPALEGQPLAPMEPFSFTARDGLALEGYVTVPLGIERAGLPAVLNVHGGPWARDEWGFNPEAQWLANRGYVCIQVNFRGSTGYGKNHVNAGDKEWGAKMHDDLLDAIDYLAGTGLIDPKQVAIYGGSYGGYAALWGATATPERFACSVDIVGPSNLKTLIESIPPYWEPLIKQFHTRVGEPGPDDEFMWERSPLAHVDNISIPLLIGQGANDPRVKEAESEQIVEAMKERGIPHEYIVYEDEGHGFARPENRLDFYAKAERFLARHMGGRCEEEATSLDDD